MIDLSPQKKNFLQNLGRSETGRELVGILEDCKDHYSNINSIDTTRDTNAQIEGRQLMGEMIDDLIKLISTQKHRVKPKQTEDYT